MFLIFSNKNETMVNTDKFEQLRLITEGETYVVALTNRMVWPKSICEHLNHNIASMEDVRTNIYSSPDYMAARWVYDTIQYHMVKKDVDVLNLASMEPCRL